MTRRRTRLNRLTVVYGDRVFRIDTPSRSEASHWLTGVLIEIARDRRAQEATFMPPPPTVDWKREVRLVVVP